MTEQNSVGGLLDDLIANQLSEAEATELLDIGLQAYQEAKGDIDINLTCPLFTPRAWWLMG